MAHTLKICIETIMAEAGSFDIVNFPTSNIPQISQTIHSPLCAPILPSCRRAQSP